MVSAVNMLGLRGLVAPRENFTPQLTLGAAAGPIALTLAVEVAVALASMPFVVRAIAMSLPPSMREAMMAAPPAPLQWNWLLSGIRPVVVAGLWTTLLFIVLGMCGRVVAYMRVGTVLACASVILAAKSAASLVILQLRGVDAIQHPSDVQPVLGLEFIAGPEHDVLRTVLGAVNVFDVWFVCIVAIALARTEGLGVRTATAAVVAVWSVMLVARISVLYFVS
jgi:hypothetical protein